MKLSPEYKKAMENMQPGRVIKTGFLGDDSRTLTDIIEHDEELCKKTGLDINEAVEKMEYLLEEGKKGLGEPITVDDLWEVTIFEARGRLPSPFEDGLFKKINARVTHISSGKTVNYSELSLHLIKKFHFFQGKGSVYRLEPEEIKAVLGL